MVTLASDMASFSNTSPEQAIEAIGAAAWRVGADPRLRRDARRRTLKAAAMKLGIYDGTGALTQQQKVPPLTSIMDQTTDAQGDFARTGGRRRNQQRVHRRVEGPVSLGRAVLPAMQALLSIATGRSASSRTSASCRPTTGAMSAFLGVAKGAGSTMADT